MLFLTGELRQIKGITENIYRGLSRMSAFSRPRNLASILIANGERYSALQSIIPQ